MPAAGEHFGLSVQREKEKERSLEVSIHTSGHGRLSARERRDLSTIPRRQSLRGRLLQAPRSVPVRCLPIRACNFGSLNR